MFKMESRENIESLVPGERYRHFKGENKIYEFALKAEGAQIDSNELNHYVFVSRARDCENPERELDVLEKLSDSEEHSEGNFWLNRGEPNQQYAIYSSLYGTEEFPFGTQWFRELEDFVGFKELNGKRVKRFTKIK